MNFDDSHDDPPMYTRKQLLTFLCRYCFNIIVEVSQSAFKGKEGSFRKILEDDNNLHIELLEPTIQEIGLQLLLQLTYHSQKKIIFSKQKPQNEVLAPETLGWPEGDNNVWPQSPNFNSTFMGPQSPTLVPETVPDLLSENMESKEVAINSARKKKPNPFINSFKLTQEEEETREDKPKKRKIKAEYERYKPLDCIQTVYNTNDKQLNSGVLGNGAVLRSIPNNHQIEEIEESPSLLHKRSKTKKNSSPILKVEVNDDDFTENTEANGNDSKLSRKGKKRSRSPVQDANKFGLAKVSIKSGMKQSSLDTFFNAPLPSGSVLKARKSDTQTALELSKVTFEQEEIMRAKEKNLDNSFDQVSEAVEEDDLGFKYDVGAVRKREERKKLTGVECKECAEFYNVAKLSDTQKQDLIQKCSKHRTKFVRDDPCSPQTIWDTDIKENPLQEKTQIASPFKPKRRRKIPN